MPSSAAGQHPLSNEETNTSSRPTHSLAMKLARNFHSILGLGQWQAVTAAAHIP